MTVCKELFSRTTDGLVDNAKTRFYPTSIPVPHHQLRHFISTAEKDLIYYAVSHDIYALDVRSEQRWLVATLPFEARCLAADLGWVCVGGELNGDCAFVRIHRQRPSAGQEDNIGVGRPRCFGHDIDIQKLGGEIVNSMNIHRMVDPNIPSEGEPVVLISNNDKTIKLYSLFRQQVLATLEHPVPMNYAALSPDSEFMVTVGDCNQVYFYLREPVSEETSSKEPPLKYGHYRWRLIATPQVPVAESILEDYSFSVAFSPCGRICAVSAQGGVISIFDMDSLNSSSKQSDFDTALVGAIRASRRPVFGCVRSMAFSPKPWDLLAWAEDHGRIGIADTRQFFVRRQILKLDKSAAGLNRVAVDDMTPPECKGLDVGDKLKLQHLQHIHRARRSISSEDAGSNELTDTWAEEARRRLSRRDLFSYHEGLDLTSRERSVLEALEITMHDVEQDYTPSRGSSSAELTSPNPSSRPQADETRDALAEAADARAGLLSHQYESRDNESPRRRMLPPRRRSSVILSPSVSLLAAPIERDRTRLTESPARMINADDESESQSVQVSLTSDDSVVQPSDGSAAQSNSNADSVLPSVPGGPNLRILSPTRLLHRARNNPDLVYELDPDFETDLHTHLTSWSALFGGSGSATVQPNNLPTGSLGNRSEPGRMEEVRRRQLAHMESLERQVRRAESRVALASSDIEALENALVQGASGQRLIRNIESRTQARARAAALATARASTSQTSTRDADVQLILTRNSDAGSQSIVERAQRARRTTELTGRISDNDIRLARLMMSSGASQPTDQNGNWVAGDNPGGSRNPTANTGSNSGALIEDAVREMGPGTAGVGWSPDGHYLYAGTEEGIYEFAINLRDRMQFPACEFR